MMAAEPHSDSPWRGLTPLDGANADDRALLVLTRGEELHAINNMIAASRVSLLYAMSGNGKTSLISAGVVPFFRNHDYIIFTTRPRPPQCRNDPRRAIREGILLHVPEAVRAAADRDALEQLKTAVATHEELAPLQRLHDQLTLLVDALPDDETLARRVREAVAVQAGGTIGDLLRCITTIAGHERPILLICDQFEELFVHFSNEQTLADFISEIGSVWSDASLNVRILFSMREDWVGSMIALRRVIPDLFKDTYRLKKIEEERARLVLAVPLKQFGEEFPAATQDRIIADLSDLYKQGEMRRLGRIELDSGPLRLVELPALHIVAETLWRTRHDPRHQAFSVAHYESLAEGKNGGEATSPAGVVLETYLRESLSKDAATRELQIDALRLLTDGERHRRAAGPATIARELTRLRPAQLNAPASAASDVQSALSPLVARGLVRPSETPGGPEYELAHDFAVRAVMSEFRQQERGRIETVGRLKREQERKDVRLRELESKDDTQRLVLQVALFAGVFGFLWMTISVLLGDSNAVRLSFAQPGPGLLVFAAFVVALLLSVVTKRGLAAMTAIVGLIIGVVMMIGGVQKQGYITGVMTETEKDLGQLQADVVERRNQVPPETTTRVATPTDTSATSTMAFDTMATDTSGTYAPKPVSSTTATTATAATMTETVVSLSSYETDRYKALDSVADDLSALFQQFDKIPSAAEAVSRIEKIRMKIKPSGDTLDVIAKLQGFEDRLDQSFPALNFRTGAGILLIATTLLLLLMSLRSAAQMQPVESPWAHGYAMLAADLFDVVVTAAPPAAIALAGVWRHASEVAAFGIMAIGVVLLVLRIFFLRRSGTTWGLRWMSLAVREGDNPITWPRAVIRELVFIGWATISAPLIPWILIAPLVARLTGRDVADALARLDVVDAPTAEDTDRAPAMAK